MSQPAGLRVGYFPTIMSGPVARFRWADSDHDIASASRDGVVVQTPYGEWRGEALAVLRVIIDAAERVHRALDAARWPRGGEPAEIIAKALGPGWTLDRPALGTRWPRDSRPAADMVVLTTYCAACADGGAVRRQVRTPSGVTCAQGHGGADGVSYEDAVARGLLANSREP